MNAVDSGAIQELNAHEQADQATMQEQQAACTELATQFIKTGKPLTDCWGDPFTHDDLMIAVWDNPCYQTAFLSLAHGDAEPLSKLIFACARYAAAVHLFGEDRANAFKFSK